MNGFPFDDVAALIALAEDYPYDRPSVGWLFDDGAIRPLEAPWHEQRTPVIACGSNRAPGRLAQKFAGGDRTRILRSRDDRSRATAGLQALPKAAGAEP
jgi:hypothetical protein